MCCCSYHYELCFSGYYVLCRYFLHSDWLLLHKRQDPVVDNSSSLLWRIGQCSPSTSAKHPGGKETVLAICFDSIKAKHFNIPDLSLSLVSRAHCFSHVYEHLHQLSFIVQLLLHCLTTAASQRGLDLLEPALIVWVMLSVCQEPVHTYKQLMF